MRIYESMTEDEAAVPYVFESIDFPVYSLEGFIYLCHELGAAGIESFNLAAAGTWIRDELKLESVYRIWEDLQTGISDPAARFGAFMEKFEFCRQWETAAVPGMDIKSQADLTYQTGDYSTALNLYLKALKASESPALYHNLALTHIRLNLYEAAQDAFSKGMRLLEQSPQDVALGFITGYARFKLIQNRTDEAMALLESIPDYTLDPSAMALYGDIRQQEGDEMGAFKAYITAFEGCPSTACLVKLLRTGMGMHDAQSVFEQIEHYKTVLGVSYPQMRLEALICFQPDAVAEQMAPYLEDMAAPVELYLTMSRFFRRNHQIIRAIEALQRGAALWGLVDELIYEMAQIAKQAGNFTDYREKIDIMVAKWKDEIRLRLDAL